MKCAILALSFFPAALAAQATQIAPPHQHGTGQLDIVFAEAEFSLSLRIPSVDIIGFETPVVNDDERTRVAIAISELSEPLNLFVVPTEAGCITTSANVILTHEISEQQGEGTSVSKEHSEFQADYIIQCQDIGALNTIEFTYFQRFSGTKKLNIRIGADQAISTHEITRDMPRLDLAQSR